MDEKMEYVSFFASIHPPGFHTHSPRHGALKWFVTVSQSAPAGPLLFAITFPFDDHLMSIVG
jgi:hypothetical protein